MEFPRYARWFLSDIIATCNPEQNWTKPNVTLKILLAYSHGPPPPPPPPHRPLAPFQCCRLAVVGALAENSASLCLSHSLINIEWGNREDCRGVTLVLSPIAWKLKTVTKVYSWEVLTQNLFLRLCQLP